MKGALIALGVLVLGAVGYVLWKRKHAVAPLPLATGTPGSSGTVTSLVSTGLNVVGGVAQTGGITDAQDQQDQDNAAATALNWYNEGTDASSTARAVAAQYAGGVIGGITVDPNDQRTAQYALAYYLTLVNSVRGSLMDTTPQQSAAAAATIAAGNAQAQAQATIADMINQNQTVPPLVLSAAESQQAAAFMSQYSWTLNASQYAARALFLGEGYAAAVALGNSTNATDLAGTGPKTNTAASGVLATGSTGSSIDWPNWRTNTTDPDVMAIANWTPSYAPSSPAGKTWINDAQAQAAWLSLPQHPATPAQIASAINTNT